MEAASHGGGSVMFIVLFLSCKEQSQREEGRKKHRHPKKGRPEVFCSDCLSLNNKTTPPPPKRERRKAATQGRAALCSQLSPLFFEAKNEGERRPPSKDERPHHHRKKDLMMKIRPMFCVRIGKEKPLCSNVLGQKKEGTPPDKEVALDAYDSVYYSTNRKRYHAQQTNGNNNTSQERVGRPPSKGEEALCSPCECRHSEKNTSESEEVETNPPPKEGEVSCLILGVFPLKNNHGWRTPANSSEVLRTLARRTLANSGRVRQSSPEFARVRQSSPGFARVRRGSLNFA